MLSVIVKWWRNRPRHGDTRIMQAGGRYVAQVRLYGEWRTISTGIRPVGYSPSDFTHSSFSFATEHDAGQAVNKYTQLYGGRKHASGIRVIWSSTNANTP